ncbi:MAG: fumarylacetoacetate hydrolase family protein [Actinomycetota bacterium]|nr:fumarylacetoacetate hydrolase family protein [Actinomycetota bacterium]
MLARFTVDAVTRVGVVGGELVADLCAVDPTLPADVGEVLTAGRLDTGLLTDIERRAPRYPVSEVRLEAPVGTPPVFLAVGLNYLAHAAESAMTAPAVPIIFNKAITCVTGPYDPIEIPASAPTRVDYEGELGVVIGARCRGVPAERAHEVVAGYVVVNDVSVRDWQFATPTWIMGKGWDTHGPVGPWMSTADEVPDPHDLRLRTWVDGELRQDSSTADMIFGYRELVAHLTTAFTLLPGTIIATGTPAGVGFSMRPPRYLQPGSRVRIEIDGIGAIDNPVVAGPQRVASAKILGPS